MEKKWYIRVHWAEDDGYALMYLTEAEAEIVRNALSEPISVGGGYCGSCFIHEKSFDTEGAAITYIYNELK